MEQESGEFKTKVSDSKNATHNADVIKLAAIIFSVIFIGIVSALLGFWLGNSDRDEVNVADEEQFITSTATSDSSTTESSNSSSTSTTQSTSSSDTETSSSSTSSIPKIKLSNLKSGDEISSPFIIRGEAPSNWFWEGIFNITIYDEAGEYIGFAMADSIRDWMVDDYVPFEAELYFAHEGSSTGRIVFDKQNASGRPELDDSFEIDVKLKDQPIYLEELRPWKTINSGQTIKGAVNSSWAFEGNFEVWLYDSEDNYITSSLAFTTEDWMQQGKVDFEVSMDFETSKSEGYLVFKKQLVGDGTVPEEFIVPVYLR